MCFLVFDNMFSTCFNEKGENTEKKIIFLWHPNNEIFSCTYALLKKINSKKEKNKTRQNIEQLISASSEISSFKSYDYTPQIFRGYK